MKTQPKNKPGRPKVDDNKRRQRLSVSLTKESVEEAQKEAEKLGITFSSFIQMATMEELDRRRKILTHTFTPTREKPADYEEEKIFTLKLLGGVAKWFGVMP